MAGNSSQNENTFLQKKSYWVTLLWSDSQCVYFIRPNTLLLCIFLLFCIFILYRADSQVKVQIRILLKVKHRKSCQKMWTPAITLWFPAQCFLGFYILEKQLASQNMFLIRSQLLLFHISFLYCIDLHPYSQYHFSKISKPFCVSRNWWIIVVFPQSNSLTITIVSQKYQELLQPYSHDRFSKILRIFCASRK